MAIKTLKEIYGSINRTDFDQLGGVPVVLWRRGGDDDRGGKSEKRKIRKKIRIMS